MTISRSRAGFKCCLGVVLALVLVAGHAAEPEAPIIPAIPDKPESEQFKDVPAPWRDHLVKARAAERIADPLQRCLAWPDIPGNQWPEGHTQAHCRDHMIRTIAIEEIAAYLDEGDMAGLESRFDVFLMRHFSSDFGEDIHYAFDGFRSTSENSDELSALWLDKAPDSAYANLARALFYSSSAGEARGTKWAAETPREGMRRMSAFVEQAISLYERAIALEPRLMPAYVGMLHAGMIDSRPDRERKAIEGAWAMDPGCPSMTKTHMISLRPRWGGSYERMLALANRLEPHVAHRPHLAIYLGAPYADRGNRLIAEDEFNTATLELLDIAVARGSNEDYLREAANVAFNLADVPRDEWKALAYLLQESRFRSSDAWGNRIIGRMLVRLEPEWSLVYSHRAHKLDPGNGQALYLLGGAYYNARHYDEAQRYYTLAMEHESQRQISLFELSQMWLYADGLDVARRQAKARPFIDRMIDEYPQDPRAWLLRIDSGAMDGTYFPEDIRSFLQVADESDPQQARAVQELGAMLRAFDASFEE